MDVVSLSIQKHKRLPALLKRVYKVYKVAKEEENVAKAPPTFSLERHTQAQDEDEGKEKFSPHFCQAKNIKS